ncbi:MAG: hypothetical protein PW735_06640 [Acidobacteriaceae bacterium]|nr:hypothetical protein [Acidobacteriaceae bacterium]
MRNGWAPGTNLDDDGGQGRGFCEKVYATVSGVIAKPGDFGDLWVKIGQM